MTVLRGGTPNSLVMSSDGSGDENQSSVVRRESKDARVNPMIQKVMLKNLHLVGTSGASLTSILLVQTKKVERKVVSSSDSEEDDKITVAYKSTRSAVSSYLSFKTLY